MKNEIEIKAKAAKDHMTFGELREFVETGFGSGARTDARVEAVTTITGKLKSVSVGASGASGWGNARQLNLRRGTTIASLFQVFTEALASVPEEIPMIDRARMALSTLPDDIAAGLNDVVADLHKLTTERVNR
jgi:hypothetical protein